MPLTLQELRVAASSLRQAGALCEGARDFFRGQDADVTARLSDILRRLDYELDFIERLIMATPGGQPASNA